MPKDRCQNKIEPRICISLNLGLSHKNTIYLCAKGKIALLVFNILLIYFQFIKKKQMCYLWGGGFMQFLSNFFPIFLLVCND